MLIFCYRLYNIIRIVCIFALFFNPLNFQNMDLNFIIEVFEFLCHPLGTQKSLARNSFPIHSFVSFDYESLLAGIRLFFLINQF